MELLLWPLFAVLAITLSLHFYCRSREMKKLAPVAAGGWPLIGHLFLLSGPDPLHITLSNMADKYGPIYSLKLGMGRGLVINTWETAKECYRINDVAMSNRPRTAAMGLMGYNYAVVGFSNYGPYWREIRKISVLRLLSNKKVTALGPARELEVRSLISRMNEYCYSSVDMRKVFRELTLALMIKTVAGEVDTDMDQKRKWTETISDFFKMMTVFTISDVLPFLNWLDRLAGMHRAFIKTGREFDEMLQVWLEVHKNSSAATAKDEDDFMREMLGAAHAVSEEFPCYDADTINKATCLTMMVGGTDTTAATLTWALALVLNNRHTLQRAQEELDIHVGRERMVQESDIEKLEYIQAIIKETMRVQPPVPVNPREARQDCTVAGYHVPKGTRIFINSWKIQRDPRVWIHPLQFNPERFLTSHRDVDVQGLHFELLPFGGGRRICPAIPLAMRTVVLMLAGVLQAFHVDTPSSEAVDMRGSFGTTNMKATPLLVCLTPRLSPQFYA